MLRHVFEHQDVVRCGANGYLLKSSAAEDLSTAILSVHSGHAFFSPSVSKILVDDYVRSTVSEIYPLSALRK